MKGIQIFFKSPLFCFHGNCGEVCPTDSAFFGLSHSTSTVVCGSFWGVEKFKMAAVAMVTKIQNGRQIKKSSDLGEIWFPSRL
jgi:hypothetical protein